MALVLAPIGVEPSAGVVSIRSRAPNKPAWLRRLDEAYWFEIEAESKTLYAQINQMNNVGAESLRSCFERALAASEPSTVVRMVIDPCHNDGGDHIHRPLIDLPSRNAYLDERGRLFVAIGSGTFSAAQAVDGPGQGVGCVADTSSPVLCNEPSDCVMNSLMACITGSRLAS